MGHIVLVASGKGGVGKSTVTCAVAKALSRRKKRVLVIDGDAGLRNQDILLDVTDRVVYDWGDVICGNISARDAVIDVEDGPSLLPAPSFVSPDWTSESFEQTVNSLKDDYDLIFIDAPAGIGASLRLLSRAAKLAVIISGSEAASIRGAASAADALKADGIVSSRLIINGVKPSQIRKKLLPDLDSIIDKTEIRLIGVLPFDEDVQYGSVNGVLNVKKNSLFDKAVTATARRIAGENVPLTKL